MSKPIPGIAAQQVQSSLNELLESIFTTSSGTTLSEDQLRKLLSGYTVGLSEQERQEMQQLREQHKVDTKVAKLATFKKLHAHMRQFVINSLTWKQHVSDINSTSADKPARLKELEQKNGTLDAMSVNTFMSDGSSFHLRADYPVDPPDGITVEELQQAHVEASMEEEILNGQEKV